MKISNDVIPQISKFKHMVGKSVAYCTIIWNVADCDFIVSGSELWIGTFVVGRPSRSRGPESQFCISRESGVRTVCKRVKK